MQGKKAFWLVVVLLVVPAAGMTVFAWRMVGGVRANAARTDARMRESRGRCSRTRTPSTRFPRARASRAFATRAEGDAGNACEAAARRGAARRIRWTGRPPALRTMRLPVDECLADIEVEWPIARDVQPILRSKGLPTLQGTAPTVGEWLYAMSERLRGE
jgi:hypothetical protein